MVSGIVSRRPYALRADIVAALEVWDSVYRDAIHPTMDRPTPRTNPTSIQLAKVLHQAQVNGAVAARAKAPAKAESSDIAVSIVLLPTGPLPAFSTPWPTSFYRSLKVQIHCGRLASLRKGRTSGKNSRSSLMRLLLCVWPGRKGVV